MSAPKPRLTLITDRPYWWVYAAGIILLVATSWLWWTRVYLSPANVFWGMVEQSLSTRSVTIETNQQSQDSNVQQLIQFELGNVNTAHSLTMLEQGTTKVQTEIIGTTDTDYSRYRSIKTDQKNVAGKPLDVSKVEGIWSKSSDQQQTETSAAGHQLFAQALLGVGLPVGSVPVPIGALTPAQRDGLVGQMKSQQIYDTSFKSVAKAHQQGRLVYTYDVKIQSIPYIRMMKQFARNLGLHELDSVDPNAYPSTEPMSVSLTVDARSRQLISVSRPQSYNQKYHAYGAPVVVQVPAHAISAAEMQQRLISL